MSQFFLALLCILFGGVSSLVLVRNFKLSKTLAVLFISGGSLWGLLYSMSSLLSKGGGTASFVFLNVFNFVFQVDGLSAFFLMVIFAVCLMAAIYSYHYMDNTQKAIRTAACSSTHWLSKILNRIWTPSAM